MKERPILFSGPMVRALLEGRKTQTRRALKPQPPAECSIHYMLGAESWLSREDQTPLRHSWEAWHGPLYANRPAGWLCGSHDVRCPYGQPGDRLWVREAFSGPYEWQTIPPAGWGWDTGIRPPIWYWADGNPEHGDWTRPKPSIHMPRWASRILLEVTDVRVERVQDMEGQAPYLGESDALAEGVNRIHHGDGAYYYSAFRDEPHPQNWADPTDAFRELWDSINAKRGFGWDANPWVWAITFKRLEPSA